MWPFTRSKKLAAKSETSGGAESRYEAASGSRQTQNHFGLADLLGPNSAVDPTTRQIVRRKARYERQNSPVLSGLVRTLSTSLIGTGPRPRVGGIAPERARRLEALWKRWAKAVDQVERLRLSSEGKYVDGDSFIVAVRDEGVPGPVKLSLVGYEADQVGSPVLSQRGDNEFDGVRIDKFGRPTHYHVYDRHPGETLFGGISGLLMSGQWITADRVLHFLRPDRVGQLRGISEFASALNSGAQTRRYGQAVLSASERGAKIAAVIETELGPDATASDPKPFEEIPMSTDAVVALPAGSKMHGYEAVQPQAQYPEYVAAKNAEWGLPVQAPRGVVSQDSSTYNFSSIRSDHLGFRDGMWVERERVDRLLDKLWVLWSQELIASDDPEAEEYKADVRNPELTVEWFWPGYSAIDPVKESAAVETRLSHGLTTLAEEASAEGKDWDEQLVQRAAEIARMKELGIPVPESAGQQFAIGPDDPNGDATMVPAVAAGKPKDGAAAKQAAVAGDVQATALNGAQIASLVLVCDKIPTKQYPADAAEAMIQAAFPLMDRKLISTFVKSLSKHKQPAPPTDQSEEDTELETTRRAEVQLV